MTNPKRHNRQIQTPDIPEAPEELIARYAALVWKTAAVYLKNPEDIKECVNDVFLEFYLHKDRYDPEKGSMNTFLASIARHKAVDTYRKSRSTVSDSEMENVADPVSMSDQAQIRLDLENAMASLNPEDFDIIRMKYYDGMTIREISESMKLPYETVKKRHQRSLSKMRLLLTLALILALTALLGACAYLLLHRFGVIPGFGITDAADAGCYLLAEPVTLQNGDLTVQITDAALYDGQLTVKYSASLPELPSETGSQTDEDSSTDTGNLSISLMVCHENEKPIRFSYHSGFSAYADPSHLQEYDTSQRDGTSTYRLEQNSLRALLRQETPTLLITVKGYRNGITYEPLVFPIQLVKAEVVSPGTYAMIYDEQNGGFLVMDSLDRDTLTLDVYPVSNGFSKYCAALSMYNYYYVDDAVPVMLTNKDDVSIEGILDPALTSESSSLILNYLSWFFPGVTPGTWTLTAPLCEPDGHSIQIHKAGYRPD